MAPNTEADRKRRLEAALAIEYERCEALDWAKGFQQACPVQGLVPADYLQKRLQIDGQQALVGIRMLGGDVQQPFVEIHTYTGELDQVIAPALAAYRAFGPQRVRVRQLQAPDVSGATSPDQWLVVGHPTPASSPVQLTPIEDVGQAMALLETGYSDHHDHHPWMRGRVMPIEPDRLRQLASAGHAYFVCLSQTMVGVLAVEPGVVGQWSGTVIIEELILREFAGQGLATRAQQALARLSPSTFLVGTIDADNKASLVSAKRAGREIVDGWWWVERPQ